MSKLREAVTVFRSHPEQHEGITNVRICFKKNSRWQPVKKQQFQLYIVSFLPLFVFSCVCPRKGSCTKAHLSHQSFVYNPGLAWVLPAQENRETERGGNGISGHGKWGCASRTQMPHSVCSSGFCSSAQEEKLISMIPPILKGISKEYRAQLK